ncbi:ABC transporter ATP-binding protein [Pseudoflavonifractor phocaeensis]|uniref:ABC transporter ATP-binding protein n=1 Tax=Pseudoflavonifractor phocaeensis TaxID=1870988 RepID=UPI0025A3BC5C|nr:ABC transporter ATP-binding protein [Pseudoflavonifractor phocaeensis]MDM8239047.1 ABC transporter ATP-binding protein [Pseudoflavonifractor phocaeensis]
MLQLFLTHLQGYKRQAIKAPILIILEVICELLLPLVMSEIVDTAIPSGDVNYIFKMGLIMLVLAGISMFCGVFASKYAAFASQGFGANLRQCLFDKVQEFSFADIDRFSSASLITRMTNDVNAMTMMLAMGLRMLVRAPVMLVAALCISFTLNAKLALVLVVVIPLMLIAVGGLMFICTRLFETMQKKIDNLNNTLQENLVAIRVVKIFVRANYERKKFKKSNDELMNAALAVGLRIIAILPIMMLAMNGATVAVLYLGGRMVMNATFDLGQLQAFINYIVQILMSVMMVAMSLLQLSRAQACAHRINEVLNTEPSVEDKPEAEKQVLPAPKGEVEFRDVSFRYVATGTGDDVLSHISFDVKPGQFVALVGGTGTGKSSLVNLIPRFYDVTGGAVLLDGMDVRDYPLEELRSRIGMVLQTNVLFTGTIRDNLKWGKEDATEEEIIQAAKDAQAYDFIMALPDGFDTMLTQGGTNVSGGQKQRLCIARAMLRKPAVLILDDSTSAVDSATEAAIRESFAKNLKDTTVIIIAQRISSVQYADEILILEDDHIAARGTHDELLRTSPIYQEIYQSQQEGVGE